MHPTAADVWLAAVLSHFCAWTAAAATWLCRLLSTCLLPCSELACSCHSSASVTELGEEPMQPRLETFARHSQKDFSLKMVLALLSCSAQLKHVGLQPPLDPFGTVTLV